MPNALAMSFRCVGCSTQTSAGLLTFKKARLTPAQLLVRDLRFYTETATRCRRAIEAKATTALVPA